MYKALLKCSHGHINQVLILDSQELDSIDSLLHSYKCTECEEKFNDEEWKYIKTVPLVP